MKLLSVDIEISDVFELAKHEDMEKYAPFHISVAATAIYSGMETVWYSPKEAGSSEPALNITREKAKELLQYLADMQNDGFMICAWNGLGFDLKWIGHVAGDMKLAARVARKSYDPMFQFFNQTGYPVGLAAVAKGMGIEQEKSMTGADAPIQWRAGNYQEVMEYVLGDCQLTNLIALAIEEYREVRWITTKGTMRVIPLPCLKTVEEVLQEPEPDQSWMTKPLLRAKFCNWAIALGNSGRIVRSRKPGKCPSCGDKPVATILYGMPIFDDELEAEMCAGRITLGGCCVSDDDPAWECTRCHQKIYRGTGFRA